MRGDVDKLNGTSQSSIKWFSICVVVFLELKIAPVKLEKWSVIYHDVFVSLHSFWKGSDDTYCSKFDEAGCWEKLKLLIMEVYLIILCTGVLLANDHPEPIKSPFQLIIHSALDDIFGDCWIMERCIDILSKQR